MHIHFIIHEVFEAPGAYLEWAKTRKHHISFSRVYEYEPIPDKADNIDLLIIMGGPQSPSTTKATCPYFDAAAEIKLIQQCIRAGKAVVGVCLGAQLIGEALYATCESSPEKEIGVFPIKLTEWGIQNEMFRHFGDILHVGHWHSDMPGLTADSNVIAVSDGCPRQIIAYFDLVYGFQCHMEFNTEVIELLINNEPELPLLSKTHHFIQEPAKIHQYDFGKMNEKLFTFLDKLEKLYTQTVKKQ